MVVRPIARPGHAHSFRSVRAFASNVDAARSKSPAVKPRGIASQDPVTVNSTMRLIATTQIRIPQSTVRVYFDKKIAEGKTRNEAMRCLKRRLMIADEERQREPMRIAA